MLELFRYLDKLFHINTLNFVNRYIFKNRWGGRVLPLQINLEPETKFLPSQEILELLSRSNVVGIGTCYCRDIQRKQKSEPNCDHPVNTCIHLGYGKSLYEIPFKSANLEKVSKEKAKKLLEVCDQKGLVHQIIYFPNPHYYYVICNCCPCCCITLSKFLKFGSPQIIKSNFIAETKFEECKDCGVCEKWCHFGARKLLNNKLEVNLTKCFGCGLCVRKCPKQAILLQKKVNK